MTRRPRATTFAIVAAVIVVIPLAVLALRAAFGSWHAVSDYAAIELRVRDVGTRRTPTDGVFSRYDWRHPGPLMFYAFAGPYRLLGSESSGLLLGAVLVNLASVATVLVVAYRRGRAVGLLITAGVVAVFLHGLGATFLHDPWNPWVVVLPLLAATVAAWNVACGAHAWLPVVIVFASFTTQAHVGTAPPAVTMTLVAIAAFAYDAARHRVEHTTRILITSTATFVVLWLPPIVDQIAGHGNLGRIARFWLDHDGDTTGFRTGTRILVPNLGLDAPWITGEIQVNPFSAVSDPQFSVPLVAVLLVVALVFAWKRRDRDAFMLGACAVALAVSGWIAASRIVDDPLEYVVRWMWIIGAVAWLAILWTVFRLVPRAGPILAGVAVAVGLVVTVASTSEAVDADHPAAADAATLVALRGPVVDAMDGLDTPVLVAHTPDFCASGLAVGLAAELDDAGIDARLPPTSERAVGRRNTVEPADAATTVVVACGADIDTYASNPAYEEITTAAGDPPVAVFRATI